NGLAKPSERVNDFGGVFGGPAIKKRTFFFFSYEGQRLRQPSTQQTVAPDAASRKQAPPGTPPSPPPGHQPLPKLVPQPEWPCNWCGSGPIQCVVFGSVQPRRDQHPGRSSPDIEVHLIWEIQLLALGSDSAGSI